ncbi:S1C family serine protease [Vagococcus sp.]|uniref:S1C family serine protease n=1 Tax=Vagococcus sp. TaxID=1933889 RepID=UPI003F94479C
MMRKDVTPRRQTSSYQSTQKKKSPWKQFGLSLLGGVIGGAIMIGGYVAYTDYINPTVNSRSSQQVTEPVENGKTKIANVKMDVNTDVTKAVKKMENAVVSVTTLQKQNSQLSELEQFFGQIQGGNNSEKVDEGDLTESGEGSGVIYRKEGNKAYVVTNNHVVQGADAVKIMLNDGESVSAKIIGTDAYSDLAVLEIDSKHVTTVAEFANSNDVKVGEPALAMGSPLGSTFANSVSQGIVSAKDRMISNKTEDGQTININAIQTDAAINPGNSGGALVNLAGQVIGINSSKIAATGTGISTEGMGFAIPSNDVVSIINQLEKDGKVIRPMLGVTMIDLTNVSLEEQSSVLKIDPDKITGGVVIGSVEKGSPAEKAGLKKFAVMTAIDGEPVTTVTDVQTHLYNKKVGDTMKIEYYYNGKKQTTTVKLDQDTSKLEKQLNEAQNSQP